MQVGARLVGAFLQSSFRGSAFAHERMLQSPSNKHAVCCCAVFGETAQEGTLGERDHSPLSFVPNRLTKQASESKSRQQSSFADQSSGLQIADEAAVFDGESRAHSGW
jgi:hypothetical protein